MRHLSVVAVDGVEAGFVLQTEHKDDSIHPRRELKQKTTGQSLKDQYFVTYKQSSSYGEEHLNTK